MRTRRFRHGAARMPAIASTVLVLASCFCTASASILLTQFQKINGFPDACTNAYSTPLLNCQTSDFTVPKPSCSAACFQDLEGITTTINNACKGVTASPSTLIGLFLENKGAQALCPNVVISGTQSGGGSPPSPSASTASSPTSASSISGGLASLTSPSPATTGTSSPSTTPAQFTLASGTSSPTTVGDTGSAAAAASTSGPATFGGGAIPFTDKNSARSASSHGLLYPALLCIVALGICSC